MKFDRLISWLGTGSLRRQPEPEVLLISGFGWSGSGAVIDYALDFPGVATFRDRAEEGSLFKGRYSLASLYHQVTRRQDIPFSTIEQVAEAFRGHRGAADAVEPKREFINLKRNEQMRRELGAERVDRAVDAFLTDCWELRDRAGQYFIGTQADLIRIGRALSFRLRSASVEARLDEVPRRMIINNDPPGYSVDLFEFHEKARYTLVTRDLIDVFANLVSLKRIEVSEKAARQFCAAQLKKLARFEAGYRSASRDVLANTFIVDFADFVSDVGVREAWREFAGLSGELVSDRFKPEESVRNIDIGGNLPQDIRAMIWERVETERRRIMSVSRPQRRPGTAQG